MAAKNDYKPLDLSILKSKKIKVISSAEALKDVEPIDWKIKQKKENSTKCVK